MKYIKSLCETLGRSGELMDLPYNGFMVHDYVCVRKGETAVRPTDKVDCKTKRLAPETFIYNLRESLDNGTHRQRTDNKA